MPLFSSRKPQMKQLPTVTGAQAGGVDTLSQMAQQFPQFFESLGFDPTRTTEAFEQGVAQPARQQFAQQTAPSIQERFIGAGAGRGSAGQRQLAQAGSQLEQGLSGQLAQQLQQGEQFGQQAQMQALMNALGLGLGTKTFENVQMPGQQSTFETLMPSVFSALGKVGGGFLGGPGGAAIGNRLASMLFGGGGGGGQQSQPIQSKFGLPEFIPTLGM